ncbi:PQQ-binding-like beta-propeller repeat protein [Streptomyces tuirus]|uniref:serine/threonine-protein kinase n=1 Tax=Streptomyces tuirus TaxID=68278 RepID=UPI00342E29B4
MRDGGRDSDPAEVGGHRIEDRLGSGGMGVVYLARSASGRRLAIKVVHNQYTDDDEFRTRFRREVAAARQVSGAFTAPVVDADAAHPWMATLSIPGADLGTHVREHGPLPLPRLRGLAEALRDIHRAGVVHRDPKPANMMLAEDGPRVIDFGISGAAEFAASDVLTQTGRIMGMPEGVVTFYGSQGDQLALLDAETGEVRWRQPEPGDQGDCVLDPAADRAHLICTAEPEDGKTTETSVSEIDPATGKPRWTVEAEGSLQMLGRQGGHLVFTDGVSMTRGLTLIDAASHRLTVRRLAEPRPEASRAYLVRGTVYFTRTSGGVRAVSPRTGRTLWESNTTLERQGPPTASATPVYFASP